MAATAARTLRRKAIRNPLFGSGLALCLVPAAALAQTVEQHPAPVLFGAQTATLSTTALASHQNDSTPFGINLGGIAVVDAHAHGSAVQPHAAAGIDTSLAGKTAQTAAFRAILARYVGQPLSYKLISAVEADITQFYRDNGRSLVNVTVPPQEITSGVLQVNINTFVLETTKVEGSTATGFLNSQIRLKPGQEVDTNRLLDDVNWLNLNPFRHVSVVFEPGATPDSTRLILKVTNGRPWTAYLGASNAGTKDTGRARVFGGFNMSALPWQDHQLSYQFTGSPESLAKFDLWRTGTDRGYLSHALTYFIPITTAGGFRTKLTFGVSHISSYSATASVLSAGTETSVGNVELSFPLPKTTGTFSLVPEIYLQAEYDNYTHTQFFAGTPLQPEKTRLTHGVLGFRTGMTGEIFGKKSRGNADLSLVFGRQATQGDASFTYALTKFSISQEMFFDKDRSLKVRLNGQYSGANGQNNAPLLHALEQMSLGGDGTVRGYPVNGVASQTAVASSIQYNFAPLSFKAGTQDGTFRPHVFADLGAARGSENAVGGHISGAHMAAIGIGGEFGMGEELVGTLDLANALTAAGATSSGDFSIAFQLTARF